jgi:hypothetical protein
MVAAGSGRSQKSRGHNKCDLSTKKQATKNSRSTEKIETSHNKWHYPRYMKAAAEMNDAHHSLCIDIAAARSTSNIITPCATSAQLDGFLLRCAAAALLVVPNFFRRSQQAQKAEACLF